MGYSELVSAGWIGDVEDRDFAAAERIDTPALALEAQVLAPVRGEPCARERVRFATFAGERIA